MLQSFIEYLDSIHSISEEAKEELAENFTFVEAGKKQMLLRAGHVCDHLHYVAEGLVRLYYLKEDQEVSSLFIEEGHLFHSPRSFYSRKPGYEFAETIEPSVIARIHYDKLQALYKKYPELNFVGRVMTERYFVRSEERLYLLRRHTAEERYTYFMEKYLALLQRVPLTYIASYLGINLETLSRIRNKIRN